MAPAVFFCSTELVVIRAWRQEALGDAVVNRLLANLTFDEWRRSGILGGLSGGWNHRLRSGGNPFHESAMRIFFSVGEPSGDVHAANLVRRFQQQNPAIECVGFGGPRMQAAGCKLLADLTQSAVMLLGRSVFAHAPRLIRLIRLAGRYFRDHRVDAVVLIDYPGFNWWIARAAKRNGVKVFYYGVPQMWAWAPWRLAKLRRLVDHVICKLPFEARWFAQRNCPATYVGHPFFDQLAAQRLDEEFLRQHEKPGRPLVLLLPGSRDQEIRANLDVLLKAGALVLAARPDVAVAVACLTEAQRAAVAAVAQQREQPVDVWAGRTQELMRLADVCIACSGSVSLELMYHRKPSIIVYRITRWQWLAQFVLLRARYITLVNLLASDKIERHRWLPFNPDAADAATVPFPEYLTVGDSSSRVAAWALRWLDDRQQYNERRAQLDKLMTAYGAPGATDRAAGLILDQLSSGSVPAHRAA